MSWLTDEELVDQTGHHATGPELALASSVITTYADMPEDLAEDRISARDRKRLARATGWQVIWMKNQPGHLTHRGVDYAPTADGVSGQRKSQAEQDLAPLAARELRNLSWVRSGSRSYRTTRPGYVKGEHMIDFLSETSDYRTVPGA